MQRHRNLHTDDRRNTLNGHWINEAFIVRLWAVLEALILCIKLISLLKDGRLLIFVESFEMRLHMQKVRPTVRTQKNYKEKSQIILNLKIRNQCLKINLILSKDTVLRPMHKKCTEYCESILSA